MTGKYVLSEKDSLEKVAVLKRLEYSPLDKELKAQTSIAENQNQELNKLFKPDEKEKRVTIKKEKTVITGESKLMYDSKYSFSDYKNVRKYYDLCFSTKYDKLLSFYLRLNEFRNLVPRTDETKMKNNIVYKNAASLYNTPLTFYFNDYNNIINEKKKRWIANMILAIHFLKVINIVQKNEEKSKSQPETIPEKVKLRRQKADD